VISPRNALLSFVPTLLFTFLTASAAHAQLRWDGNVQAGVAGRLFGNNAGGVPGSVGPVVAVAGDIAIVPLLRLGAYLGYEYADTGEQSSPSIVSFGTRVKLMIPGYRRNIHWWLFTGFGAAVLEAPGYTEPFTLPGTSANTLDVPTASGYFFEIPVGIGMGWRVRKPWEIVAELQGRVGFGQGGSYFTDNGTGQGLSRPATAEHVFPDGTVVPASLPPQVQGTGADVFALMLTIGIGLDE
jgi:hypothetical protein